MLNGLEYTEASFSHPH